MSWVEWLKEVAERLPGGAAGKPEAPRPAPRVRVPRKGGESYAREWVRVLEDADPRQDPANTYTWELHPDKSAQGRAHPASRLASRTAARSGGSTPDPKADAFDTYTWELHETESPEDPWGMNQAAPPTRPSRTEGVNPYDTGAFDTTWRGRFDRR
jgi:hypothetical protein